MWVQKHAAELNQVSNKAEGYFFSVQKHGWS